MSDLTSALRNIVHDIDSIQEGVNDISRKIREGSYGLMIFPDELDEDLLEIIRDLEYLKEEFNGN